jgi:prepilin peptidase CpaA
MMHPTTLEITCAVATAIVVVIAMVTDLRSRRIPNALTFTAFGVAVVVHLVFQGWLGLGLALAGAVSAPAVLLLVHLGRGLGMGDVKLAAAVGAFLGPMMAVAAMLCAAIIGGVLAIALLMRRGQLLAELFGLFLIDIPFMKIKPSIDPPATAPAVLTMPYGVAIGIGSLVTLVVYAWLGT